MHLPPRSPHPCDRNPHWRSHMSTATYAAKPSKLAKSARCNSEPVRHSEGRVAKAIEEQTAKLPSDTFLWAAFSAIGVAMVMQASGKKQGSLFVGQWVAPFLIFGLYNNLVKV